MTLALARALRVVSYQLSNAWAKRPFRGDNLPIKEYDDEGYCRAKAEIREIERQIIQLEADRPSMVKSNPMDVDNQILPIVNEDDMLVCQRTWSALRDALRNKLKDARREEDSSYPVHGKKLVSKQAVRREGKKNSPRYR
ncbi:9736_t:CDS:2 [Funneliformis geosporum]|nr:9736_t:CDS:2 [Funneliformis geosporum]